ncbi:MAG: hypothetical protein L7F77_14355 [Candidatus Magnetominusculus sp. LBB02]|nr:hypothetical protein [Candidatus Magnetominusculus sp. LBB02]
MTFNKKAKDIFWITETAYTLDEHGDYDVGETFAAVLTLFHTEIEPSESAVKSLNRIDVNLYEGVGRVFDISKDNGPALLFDCGLYAYESEDTRQYFTFPEGIESGSYVKMRFTLKFVEGYDGGLRMNGEPISKLYQTCNMTG